MKSKEYVERAIQYLNSMTNSFIEVGNKPDMLYIDKRVVDVMTNRFPITKGIEYFFRGIPVIIVEDFQWCSLYNFRAYKDGQCMFRHYTLLG